MNNFLEKLFRVVGGGRWAMGGGLLSSDFCLLENYLLSLHSHIENRQSHRKSSNRQSTIDNSRVGPVVQWIERQIPVLKVVGSTPAGVTKNIAALSGNIFYVQFCI